MRGLEKEVMRAAHMYLEKVLEDGCFDEELRIEIAYDPMNIENKKVVVEEQEVMNYIRKIEKIFNKKIIITHINNYGSLHETVRLTFTKETRHLGYPVSKEFIEEQRGLGEKINELQNKNQDKESKIKKYSLENILKIIKEKNLFKINKKC